ncbi:MAG: UvrD-helicase domain-containing protein [Bacteroidales bacterium]|nr:UvrD-helicase domain-containing protein [Bacteroidales bacterium]MBQ8811013.1 UvrD-helicase domain-containing protein [Bacteroidales bacterium]
MENRSSAILEGLNSEQKAAVSCVDGPVLIVAGAGSGKTRVLTSRIAYILERGCDPSRILALTFTKKAASEMKERIALLVGERKARKLYMGTFHSVFIRFLREFSESLGYPSTFTIYDTSDSVSAIKTCLKELQLDEKVYKPKDVLSRISMAKNNLVTASAYRRNPTVLQNDAAARKPRICDIYDLYAVKCRQAGVMDFDDILLNMNILLRDNPAALESIAGRFDYIMVDEYQDTNFSQYLILKKLSQFHKNICVVGDDSQSIYAFRGAKIENILNFKKDYPEHHIFRLEQNYRSTRTIVDAANSLIARNSARIPKECYSMGEEGEKIRLIQAYTEQEEALLIASSIISRIHSESALYQDFAILYRTNAQSRALEEALRKRNLPYVIYSGNSFFERAEVKDMMAYLKLAVNLNDDESFKRIVNKPARGIGDTSLAALASAASAHSTSLFKAVYADDLETFGLKNAAIQKMRTFCEMMNRMCVRAHKEDAYDVAAALAMESGLLMFYKSDTSIEGQSRTANVEELLNSVKTYIEEKNNEHFEELQADGAIGEGVELSASDLPVVTLGDYLENVSLLSAVDMEDDEDGSNKVTLMTVHSSKGLEFPYVYVAGMEENIFPSGGFLASDTDVEEERRLFYVAMTRAKKAVAFSFAQTRTRNGKHESNSPSRFIREVDPKYIANPLSSAFADVDEEPVQQYGGWKRTPARPSGYSYGQSSRPHVERRPQQEPQPVRRPQVIPKRVPDADFEPTPVLQLRAGQRIEHNRFGYGKIVEISGNVTDLKAKISFDDHGEKILILKYAKIRAVDVAE